MADLLTIGEVARRSGVATSALRFYEDRGLIASERTGVGHRRYPRAVVRRVAFIVFAQRAGLMTLEEIGTELAQAAAGPDAEARRLGAGSPIRGTRGSTPGSPSSSASSSGLTECIGCGCLSLDRCKLANPGDRAGQAGPGPRFWIGRVLGGLAERGGLLGLDLRRRAAGGLRRSPNTASASAPSTSAAPTANASV